MKNSLRQKLNDLIRSRGEVPYEEIVKVTIEEGYKPSNAERRLRKSESPEAQTILDPFAGSGTAAVAAKMEGRSYIGIEISPKYCAIARERLKHITPKLL